MVLKELLGDGFRLGKGIIDNSEIRINVKYFLFLEIVLLTILTFYPLLHVGYTTNDDTRIALWAISQDRMNIVSTLAESQGRFQFLFGSWLSFVPYIFNNFIYLKVISTIALILNILFFMYTTHIYLRSAQFSIFSGIVYLIAIQNSWNHNILTSYPFCFSMGFNFLLISLILLGLYFSDSKKIKLISSIIFFNLSLLVYETFCLYVVLFPLLAFIYYYSYDLTFKKKITSVVKIVYPYVLSVFIYAIIYLIYRSFFPGSYDGVKIASFSFEKIFNVIFKYSISSFPTILYFYTEGFHGYRLAFINIIETARVEWIVKSILASWGAYICLYKMKNVGWSKHKIIILILISCLLIFLPNVLYALTPKYQKWVEIGSPAFIGTYFSFFGMTLLISSLILYFKEITSRYLITNKLYSIFVIILIFNICLITDYENYAVTKNQTLSQYKWNTLDEFFKTKEFLNLPDDSLVYAPSLWKYYGIVANHPSYWSDYVKIKISKNVKITDNKEELKKYIQDNNSDNVYYLKYSQDPEETKQFLVFSKIENIQIDNNNIVMNSKTAKIFTYSNNKKFFVFGNVINKDQQNIVTIDENKISSSSKDFFAYLVNKENENKAFIETELSSNNSFDLSSITISNYLDYYRSYLPLYDFGSEIRFDIGGNAIPYQVSGWSAAEKEFTWTDGNKASLEIPIGEAQSDLVLKVKMFPLLGSSVTKQRVSVNINENSLGQWNVDRQDEYEIQIPKSILKDSVLKVTFEIPDAITPKELNIGNDIRVLGIAVQSLIVYEKE